MFVSASTRCFAEMDVWQALQQITDLEFDKAELWLDEAGSLKPSELVAAPEDFAAAFHEKTRLTPVAFTLADHLDASSFAELAKLAKGLKITLIVIPSDELGTPFNSEIDRLKELCRVAGLEGVRVAIRTEKGRLSEDAHTAVELCRAVKGLGVSYDPSYFLANPDDTIDLVAPHTVHVHLRDSTPEQLQVQVGLGEVDYARIISQLEKEKYPHALSIEFFPDMTELEYRQLEMRKLRRLIESLLK